MPERYMTVVSSISKILNKVGEICIVLNMLLIVINILFRVLINKPLAGLVDYVGILTTVIIGPTLAYCATQNGHIQVEFIMDMFPVKAQKLVEVIINFINFVFLTLLAWHIGRNAFRAYLTNELPMTAKIPLYPFIYIVAVGVGLFALVSLGKLLLAIHSRKEV